MRKGFTTACQIKDLFSRFAPNGGQERFRFVVETSCFDNFNSHTIGRLGFVKCKALNSHFAFTLAEVLITLAIIGVVAALTIPTVVIKYQKQETVTRLKKTFSAFENTTNLAITDNGPIEGWVIGTNETAQASADFTNKYLAPYLKVSKNCENRTTGDCAFIYYPLNSATQSSLGSQCSRFYLNDGTFLATYVTNDPSDTWATKRVLVFIDINGQKKPNKLGKDVFYFYYIIDSPDKNIVGKLIADGQKYDRATLMSDAIHNCNKNQDGNRCSALIMKDGWQIKDDYPWN